MDGKASARVTQVEQVWVQKKIATNLSNLLRSSEIPFFQLCQLFTAHNLPSEESLEIRKQIWWAAWIWKRLDIDKHIFSFLKPWCLIKTWEPRCKLLYNLAVSPMSTLTDLRWVTDGESFLKSFKIPFLGGVNICNISDLFRLHQPSWGVWDSWVQSRWRSFGNKIDLFDQMHLL